MLMYVNPVVIGAMLVSNGHATVGAMLTWVISEPGLLPRTMLLPQTRSVLIFMAHVATKGHIDV